MSASVVTLPVDEAPPRVAGHSVYLDAYLAPLRPFLSRFRRYDAVAETHYEVGNDFYEKLLGARRGREAFGTGALRILDNDNPSAPLYTRASADETYLVALSMDENDPLSAIAADADLPGEIERLLGDAVLTRDGRAARVAIPPAGMGIFRVR